MPSSFKAYLSEVYKRAIALGADLDDFLIIPFVRDNYGAGLSVADCAKLLKKSATAGSLPRCF